MSDDELIYYYRQGNVWALEELRDRYINMLYRLLIDNFKEHNFLDSSDFEECKQLCEIHFIHCVENYSAIHDAAFITYLYQSIKMTIFHYISERAATLKHEEFIYDVQKLRVEEAYREEMEQMYRIYEANDHLRNVDLGSMEKEVLRYMHLGYKNREIAEEMGIEPRQVTNAVYRIRKKIRIIPQ